MCLSDLSVLVWSIFDRTNVTKTTLIRRKVYHVCLLFMLSKFFEWVELCYVGVLPLGRNISENINFWYRKHWISLASNIFVLFCEGGARMFLELSQALKKFRRISLIAYRLLPLKKLVTFSWNHFAPFCTNNGTNLLHVNMFRLWNALLSLKYSYILCTCITFVSHKCWCWENIRPNFYRFSQHDAFRTFVVAIFCSLLQIFFFM